MIKIDLNQITRKDFMELIQAHQAGRMDDAYTARLVERVVTEWPYDQPISAAGFQALGLLDSRDVEQAVTEALEELAKKN